MKTIEKDGYAPVQCDPPLACPFCGGAAELSQIAHGYTSDSKGKPRRYCIVASTSELKADTFWFKCDTCKATTGGHHASAQSAVIAWNTRTG